jgi:mRNA interferase MazF
VIPFPFSDLSQAKRRPAVVIADAGKGDGILCMVTSNAYADPLAIALTAADFAKGSLRQVSYARPGKLFTAHETLMSTPIAELKPAVFEKLRDAVKKVIG